MKQYAISYRQSKGGETETTYCKGYDADHATERFMDSMAEEGGIEGVEVLDVVRVATSDGITRLA